MNKNLSLCFSLLLYSTILVAQTSAWPEDRVAADFRQLLERPRVAPQPSFETVRTDSVIIEQGTIYSEKEEKVPILIYKPVTGEKSYPAVIFLHGTGGKKDSKEITTMLYQLTKRGIMGIAIDARYHGARVSGGAHGSKQYVEACTRAWENTDATHQEHPFFFDTVYDLWRLMDYLVTRPDIKADRIGMGGISMGGIETWMAASVDPRVKVIVLDIAAQSFKWSLDNDRWQGRVGTIRGAHVQAAKDLGDSAVNGRNVKIVWDKLLPGITGEFDCPSLIRLMAPRPLLILSTEKDQNCPLPGAKIAYASAMTAYTNQNAMADLKMDIAPNLPHTTTPEHTQMTLDWFSKWL
ncbi:MAG TPA: acetylxylan esterase [Puia sp.]|jgi:predicted peptidase